MKQKRGKKELMQGCCTYTEASNRERKGQKQRAKDKSQQQTQAEHCLLDWPMNPERKKHIAHSTYNTGHRENTRENT